MSGIRVAICDDTKSFCDAMWEYFEFQSDMELVGLAYSGTECLSLVEEQEIDILLLDIEMESRSSGLDIIPGLLARQPALKIIMLTCRNDEESIFDAFAAGAVDYFVKDIDMLPVFDMIRGVYHGEISIHPDIAQKLSRQVKHVGELKYSMLFLLNVVAKLSKGELDLLKNLYAGKSYTDIAAERVVEPNTVRKMGAEIIKKLGAADMKEVLKTLRETKAIDLFFGA